MKKIQIRVFGIVQGVFFRVNTKKISQKLKLNGWVRNENNGSVKIIAQGAETKLNKLVSWCHQGPTTASVERVEVRDSSEEIKNSGFVILLKD